MENGCRYPDGRCREAGSGAAQPEVLCVHGRASVRRGPERGYAFIGESLAVCGIKLVTPERGDVADEHTEAVAQVEGEDAGFLTALRWDE